MLGSSSSVDKEQSDRKKTPALLYLNVYDLTPVNNYLNWFGFVIFHSGIEGETTGTGTRHTCVVYNPHIEEEEKYKAEFSKLGDKLKISRQQGGSQEKKEEKMKTITLLHELHPDNYMIE